MLVLTRKPLQEVVIYDPARPDVHVVVSVISVDRGKQVRIGFEAGSTMSIMRKEIYDRIQREKHGAGQDDQVRDGSEKNLSAVSPVGRAA